TAVRRGRLGVTASPVMIADLGDLRAPTAGAKTGPPARIASSSVQTGPAPRRSEAATNPDVTCRSLGMREHWPGGRQAGGWRRLHLVDGTRRRTRVVGIERVDGWLGGRGRRSPRAGWRS